MDFQSFKGVIFDLDGTLLDSMGVWHAVDRAFLAKRGIPYPPGYDKELQPLNYAQAAAYTKRRFGLPESEAGIISEWDARVRDAYARGLPLKPGAAALLRRLRGRGVKIGLATASSRTLYGLGLKANGVYEYFDVFVTLDEPGLRSKLYPDIYLRTAQRLGVAPADCVVFEDILNGIRGAQAAGMKAVAIYDASSAAEQEQLHAEADGYYTNFTEIDW